MDDFGRELLNAIENAALLAQQTPLTSQDTDARRRNP
jgi:hypothetical protein